MEVRFADISDLKGIVDIYNQAIHTHKATADLEELTINDKLNWFLDHTNDTYPIYVAVIKNKVVGWCSISPYRPGRMAVRQTAEISYYVDYEYHGLGVGSALMDFAINDCKRLGIKNLFALILEWNVNSIKLVEKFSFEKWGYLPRVANLDGKECGHCIYGKRIW